MVYNLCSTYPILGKDGKCMPELNTQLFWKIVKRLKEFFFHGVIVKKGLIFLKKGQNTLDIMQVFS